MTNPFHYLIKPTPAEPETPLQLGLLCSPGPLERAPDKGVQPKAASVEEGPGQTRYIVNGNGGISRVAWNDPSWTTTLADAVDLQSPHRIASLLRAAYEAGFEDRGVAIRRAIGQAERLG